ncbi:hypothetical protein Ocin01_09611 [Orchesella cincta]|uniref:RING-type domain-containing protein n=1 Tax=Orchesella cincta TaxID=48709 RepID=A0A1D2MVI3_ORCCI|nr:hypothetical protein Ocin01_09611 [Orchesella cincta]
MGFITKVRGRVQNAPKTGSHQWGLCGKSEFGLQCNVFCHKSGTAWCYNFHKNPETMLILLLLPILMGRIGLLYACVIYQYPLHIIYEWMKKWSLKAVTAVKPIISRFRKRLDECENSFVNMNLYAMMNQMVFFSLCDRALGLRDRQRVTSMYSLLFYNAMTYCFAYIKELVEKEDWSMKIQLTPSSNIMHLAMTATKIALEWTKAVTFIVTIVCMLLVLGLEQGLQNYCPTPVYILITVSYYIMTEKTIQDSIPNVLIYVPDDQFQDQILGLEKIHAMLAIKLLTTLANLLFLIPMFRSLRITLLTLYINVWLQYKSSKMIKTQLDRELELVANFRQATEEDFSAKDEDDVCPICLGQMKSARVTPCQHMFHTNCLRLCVKNLNNCCPICKREFRFY